MYIEYWGEGLLKSRLFLMKSAKRGSCSEGNRLIIARIKLKNDKMELNYGDFLAS